MINEVDGRDIWRQILLKLIKNIFLIEYALRGTLK